MLNHDDHKNTRGTKIYTENYTIGLPIKYTWTHQSRWFNHRTEQTGCVTWTDHELVCMYDRGVWGRRGWGFPSRHQIHLDTSISSVESQDWLPCVDRYTCVSVWVRRLGTDRVWSWNPYQIHLDTYLSVLCDRWISIPPRITHIYEPI